MSERQPRAGAVRYKDAGGNWQWANPGDAMFSTATMLATEHFTGSEWKAIFEDDLLDAEREDFEAKCWAYYQGLKAKGWSHPEEGDSTDPAALFWRNDDGRYGVHQIEAAWNGWQMAKGLK